MNRKQFQLFSGKLHTMAIQLESDARRVGLTGSVGGELANRLRDAGAEIRAIAETIESTFG